MTSAADDEAAPSTGCEEIAVREKEISGITNRLLSSAPDSIQTQVEEVRRLVEDGIQNLQSLFSEYSPAAKQELHRHLVRCGCTPWKMEKAGTTLMRVSGICSGLTPT